MAWWVYILECADATFYTGITTDIAARLNAHTKGSGAKYTRGRGPFTLRFSQSFATKSDALKRELEIKKLSRAQKLALMR